MNSKIIVALDFNHKTAVYKFLDTINPDLCKVKIGLELFSYYGPELVKEIVKLGYEVFLDLKFHDIPNTVENSLLAIGDLGVWLTTIHAMGGVKMLEAAHRAREKINTKIIAVSVLTSFANEDLTQIGLNAGIESTVESLAKLTFAAKIDGLVCSSHEISLVRAATNPDFLIVTPGIRLDNTDTHDQKRVMTPEQAIKLGADYLVIGRAITKAVKPSQVLESIAQQISGINPRLN